MRQLSIPILLALVLAASALAQTESLPAPVLNGNSFEIVSNSRYSAHSGFTSSLPTQVLSNVLWAMNKVPSFGSFREIYIATPTNVYLYDSAAHALVVHLAGNHRYSSGSAFEVGIATERNEEAGLGIQAGLLAGDAFWSRGSGNVASCPMYFATNNANSNWNPLHTIQMVNVYGQMSVTGLTDSCVAVSSDSTLPTPLTDRADTFEVVAGNLGLDTVFDPSPLPLGDLSQLLWAGYGVTPHSPLGKRGLTVPSAVAYYYLTRRIYLVTDTAVFRYHNRLPPGTSHTTRDHRLELVTSGDRRDSIRAACSRLPQTAPAYIVICFTDTTTAWALQEAGFVGYQYLMQAEALGLAACLTMPLTPDERTNIRTALGLPGNEHPAMVFSAGHVLTGVREQSSTQGDGLRAVLVSGASVRLEYWLARSGDVGFAVYDMAGRVVRTWTESQVAQGQHVTEWPGTDNKGLPVPAGSYLCQMTAGNDTQRCRVTLVR